MQAYACFGIFLHCHSVATQCELWVCGDGDTGLRVEKGGFEKYV